MKTILFVIFIVICGIAASPHTSRAQELPPRPIVRLIYFYPRDRAPQPGIDKEMDRVIKATQEFYAQLMKNHGFDRKTFLFETDAQGRAVVHHVKGRFTDAHYRNNWEHWDTVRAAWDEAEERFDRSNHILFTVFDVDVVYETHRAGIPGGGGGGDARSGNAYVLSKAFDVRITVHELGHAFGLFHDGRAFANRVTTLGIADRMATSFSAAEWLNVIPAFNANPTPVNRNTTVEMLTPNLVSSSTVLRLRFKVADPDGLHQVQLYTYELDYTGVMDALLQDYKGLKRTPSTTVELVTDAVKREDKAVTFRGIDVHGNVFSKNFPIDITSLLPPPNVVSIPDPNLAAKVREALRLAPSDAILTHTLLNLRRLYASRSLIRDLTGLEHAGNLQILDLRNNRITDLSPLAELTQLTSLQLGAVVTTSGFRSSGNHITDVSPLAGLTILQELDLSNNRLTDMSPLAGLTRLETLYLDDNRLTDVTPLAVLTGLTQLSLSGNHITDVSPLAGLTRLRDLDLSNNRLTDVSLLAGLTRLEKLYLDDNYITDVSPLMALRRQTPGENWLYLRGNPLGYASINTHIPAIEKKWGDVNFDERRYPTLHIVSGVGQHAAAGEDLANPLVVEAIDASGASMPGVSVTFAVIEGDGELSITTTITDANGRAETTLTLGPNPGVNRVRATGEALRNYRTLTFTAIATAPDLVVEALQVLPATLAPGKTFRLYATLRNQGTGNSPPTTLQYYRSTNNTISTNDTPLGTDGRDSLAVNGTVRRYLTITAPTTPGTYYYGGCVDSVANEINVTNNCSAAVEITVTHVVPGDVNGDGVVNIQDLVIIASQLGQTGANSADVNGDGTVNIQDLVLVAGALGAEASAPVANP